MASLMDWIPMHRYGEPLTVGPGSTTTYPLLDPSGIIGGAVEGRHEHTTELFVHRIVGQWHAYMLEDSPIVFPWALHAFRIGPGLVFPNGNVSPPWAADFARDGISANARFWWDRRQHILPVDQGGLTQVDHPWWSQIDIKPKQKLGISELPLLSIQNEDDVAGSRMSASFFLRLLVSAV